MANHKVAIYVYLTAGILAVGSSVPARANLFHKENAPSASSASSCPEVAAADEKVNQAKQQLETAKKQLDAARAILRAANADYKAAIADRQAIELRTTAKDLANASGLQTSVAGDLQLAAKPAPQASASEPTSAPVPSAQDASVPSVQEATPPAYGVLQSGDFNNTVPPGAGSQP